MKPFYNLILIILSWLVLSPCICHPDLRRNHSNHVQCIHTERDALLQFKHGILEDYCGLLTSWGSHTDCCRWRGVVCSNLTSHVLKLELVGSDVFDSCLQGKVSPSLGELKHLEHLNLSYNNFYGEIPHQLGNLSMLTILDLNYAYYGVLVQSLSWISRLTSLRYLDLSGADLSEVRNWVTIINNLPSLRVLSLGFCELSQEGKVSPSLGELKHLEHLNLSNNNFYEEIPNQLGNLSKLTTLDLSYAYNDGVPAVQSLSWISRLTLLRYLDLSYAHLSEVRNWITIVNNLPSLQVLSMGFCELSQEIPSSISYVNSSTTLHTIRLDGNYFKDGSIFQWLFNLPRITTQPVHLDLSFNDFEGPIPSEIGNLHSLSYLDLSFNYFEGPIPSEIGNLHSLSYLDLSVNNFEGPIPSEIGNLHSLSYLDLSENKFQRSVSKILSNLCNLEHLNLGTNNLTDELSNVIHSLIKCNNKALLGLDLSSNRFWGQIPDDIGSISSLRELNLGSNQLKGDISPGIRQLTKLEIFDVSSNSLEGTLNRTFFSRLVNLRQLTLSDNPGLVINIEEDWIPPFKLNVILLRSCKLGPRFPKWLRLQTNFSYFDISNTGIFDNIPVSFSNSLSSNLQYLNMSYNQLYGKLLRDNQLKGEISPGIGQLTMLEILDVSSNSLEGTLTSTFFSGLVSLRQLILLHNLRLEISTEEDWIPPFKLDVIVLRSCKLGPRFPKWLQLQANNFFYRNELRHYVRAW